MSANIYGGTEENPTLMSSVSATDYVYKGKDGNNHADWYESYVGVDVSSLTSWVTSASGGIHSNLHFIFDETKYGQTTLTSDKQEMFQYNGVKIALGYNFEAASGTTAKIVNTNANGLNVDLSSLDNTVDETVFGLRGRTFSIGNGITLEAKALTVSGRLTTSEPIYTDSQFRVLSGGAVNIAGSAIFLNTNLYVAQGATLTSAATSQISNNSLVEIAGTFNASSGGLGMNDNGGKVIVDSTGSLLSVNGYTIKGGELVVNGYIGGTTSAKSGLNTRGTSTLTVGEGATTNIDINLGDSSNFTVSQDTQIKVLRADTNAQNVVLNIADGKTLTASDTNFMAGASLEINGNIHITNIFGIYCTGSLNKGSILADNGFSLSNAVDFTVANGASITSGANISIGGNLILADGASASAKGIFKIDRTLNSNGAIAASDFQVSQNAVANLNGGTLTSDKITVSSGGLLNTSGSIDSKNVELGATSEMNIKGGTVVVGKDVLDSSKAFANSSSNINILSGGTLNLTSDTVAGWATGGAIHTGSLNVNGGTLKGTSKTDASYGLVVSKNVALSNGGKIVIATAKTYLAIGDNGNITTDSTSRIDSCSGIVFAVDKNYTANRTLQIASDDVLSGNKDFIVIRTTNNKIELASGESYHFNSLKFHDKANSQYNEITIDLNGAQVEFDSVVSLGSTASLGRIILNDFAAGLVKVDNFDGEKISSGTFSPTTYLTVNLVAYGVNGALLDGSWSIDSNGYLFNSALVPEPAEWAAIFGLLAIALALYRRRK